MQRSIHRLSVSENALPFARFAMRASLASQPSFQSAPSKKSAHKDARQRAARRSGGDSLSRLGDENFKQTEVTEKEVTSLPYLLLGRQRRIGFRAAVTSSRREMRVECGADFTSSGVSSASRAIERIASMNRSSSSSDSLSVGSIISAPFTINGKLTV